MASEAPWVLCQMGMFCTQTSMPCGLSQEYLPAEDFQIGLRTIYPCLNLKQARHRTATYWAEPRLEELLVVRWLSEIFRTHCTHHRSSIYRYSLWSMFCIRLDYLMPLRPLRGNRETSYSLLQISMHPDLAATLFLGYFGLLCL